jgi:CBS domain-containing protein
MLTSKVSEIMTREVITAEVSRSIQDVMETMTTKNVGCVVLTDKQMPTGIFTERDVLKRVMNKNLDFKKAGIREVMTSHIYAVEEDTHIVEALGKMYQKKFRHLLVRGKERAIVGMVSMRDILKLAVKLGEGLSDSRTIGSILSGNPVTADVSQSIYETIEIMVKKNKTGVVVQGGGKPKGIFTERDVLKRVATKDIDTKKTPIKRVMTTDFKTASHSTLVGEILAEMYQKGFRNLPIRGDEGELVGVVSMGDVLKYAKALDVDEAVRKSWKEVEKFWDSEEHYTPG